MESEEKLLQKRFLELSARADAQNRYTYTPFLTLAEQSLLHQLSHRLQAPFVLLGGYPGAERRVACFGREEEIGAPPAPPFVCLKAAPVQEKFASALTHRDFLGAMMALGLKRETLGDLLIEGKSCYVFCLDEVAEVLCRELKQAGRTNLNTLPALPPQSAVEPPEETSLTVASERLDAMISAVWRLSRRESAELFEQQLVFVNGRQILSPSASPDPGEIISVRGRGRFRYEGIERETKKGRIRITVRIY